jgi:hypothetical protein
MLELSPSQVKILEQLLAAGFRPVAIPPYESALCVRRGECAAILSAVPNGGLRMLAPPSYLVDGNLSVKLKKGNREVFAWKKNEVEATPERLRDLAAFRKELTELLEKPLTQ